MENLSLSFCKDDFFSENQMRSIIEYLEASEDMEKFVKQAVIHRVLIELQSGREQYIALIKQAQVKGAEYVLAATGYATKRKEIDEEAVERIVLRVLRENEFEFQAKEKSAVVQPLHPNGERKKPSAKLKSL